MPLSFFELFYYNGLHLQPFFAYDLVFWALYPLPFVPLIRVQITVHALTMIYIVVAEYAFDPALCISLYWP